MSDIPIRKAALTFLMFICLQILFFVSTDLPDAKMEPRDLCLPRLCKDSS